MEKRREGQANEYFYMSQEDRGGKMGMCTLYMNDMKVDESHVGMEDAKQSALAHR